MITTDSVRLLYPLAVLENCQFCKKDFLCFPTQPTQHLYNQGQVLAGLSEAPDLDFVLINLTMKLNSNISDDKFIISQTKESFDFCFIRRFDVTWLRHITPFEEKIS